MKRAEPWIISIAPIAEKGEEARICEKREVDEEGGNGCVLAQACGCGRVLSND